MPVYSQREPLMTIQQFQLFQKVIKPLPADYHRLLAALPASLSQS